MARWPVPRLPQPPGPVSATGPGPDAALVAGPEPFDQRVIWVGGVVFAVLMALSPRYGFHRDELYFLDCARHLQASYVDQPVLTPLLAWVSLKLFGVSLAGLRLWPALAAGATVVISGLTARELGGGRRAQLLAAVGTGTMPALLASGHLAGTTPYDVLAWTTLALVVVHIGRTGDCRWWLAAGLILGLGLANKHSAGLFAAALVAGALLSGGRAMVLNRWFLVGAAIALAFTVPDLWWQAQHQWATIAMTQALNRENGGLGNAGTSVIGQLIMVSLALVWVWLAGLRFLWRSGRPLWRALAWAYGLLFVLFAVTTGAKIYYLAGTYPCLLAAGFVSIDGWLVARPGRVRNLMLATGLTTLTALPVVLPVLPAADVGWTATISGDSAESIGWPQLVQTVHTVWLSLPSAQRAHAVIFTANYGEAGAINELGRADGLPTAAVAAAAPLQLTTARITRGHHDAGGPHLPGMRRLRGRPVCVLLRCRTAAFTVAPAQAAGRCHQPTAGRRTSRGNLHPGRGTPAARRAGDVSERSGRVCRRTSGDRAHGRPHALRGGRQGQCPRLGQLA